MLPLITSSTGTTTDEAQPASHCVARPTILRSSAFLSDPFVHAQAEIHFNDKSLLTLFGALRSQTFWRQQIRQILPSQTQCDVLLFYFFEHANWIFQTIHAPTFRAEVRLFWQNNSDNFDVVWLALLLQILSLSALYIPVEFVELLGIERTSIRKLAVLWYQASRQCVSVRDPKSKATILHLQVFSIAQLYWYATNDIETLNMNMAQAIRAAQTLELDKICSTPTSVTEDLRIRLWWELVDSDTFQSMCLGIPPLIRVNSFRVPYPLNLDDLELGGTLSARSLDQPTQNSLNVFRAKFFELMNGYICSLTTAATFEQVTKLDTDLTTFLNQLPWYFRVLPDGRLPQLPSDHKSLLWQSHILRTCVCTQIIRLYQPYLAQSYGNSRARCFTAAQDMLSVYKVLRADRSHSSWQKFFPQAYQVFSMAVTMAALLLVDTTHTTPTLSDDVMMLASDLDTLAQQGCTVAIGTHGADVVRKILSFVRGREQFSKADSDALAQDISIILGGEASARSYIEHATPNQNSGCLPDKPPTGGQPVLRSFDPTPGMAAFDNAAFDQALLDPSNSMYPNFDDQFPISFDTAGADLLNWDLTGLLNSGVDDLV